MRIASARKTSAAASRNRCSAPPRSRRPASPRGAAFPRSHAKRPRWDGTTSARAVRARNTRNATGRTKRSPLSYNTARPKPAGKEAVMSMPVSEKSFLERIASYVPGVAGYRERESRRETDRRIREVLAARLDEGRASLNALRNPATDAGELKTLDAIGRLDRVL